MDTTTNLPTGRFGRLADWAFRHRWGALALWVLVLAAVTATSQAAGSAYDNDFSLPGTDSQRAADLLADHGVSTGDGDLKIVLRHPDGLAAGDTRRRVTEMLDEVARLPGVGAVRAPYDDATAVSRDGTIGYATVAMRGDAENLPAEQVRGVIDTAQAAEAGDLRVEVGGGPVREAQESEGGGSAEGAGMLAALVILVLLFGSLVAAALPLLTAVFAVSGAIGLITLASHVFTVADFTPPIMMLIGLGVGVDYALLIFYRYRHELRAGADPESAAARALDSAGRTVFFAGCTVIVALLGLVVLGLGSLQGVALAVALTVLVTMLASLTLLPALLGVFGGRIQRIVGKRAARRPHAVDGARWRRMVAVVQRRPLPALLIAVTALLALSAPALDLRLGFADAGSDAASSTSRQAHDLLADGFGPGVNGPLVVVGRGAPGDLRQAVAAADGVVGTSPVIPVDGDVFTLIVTPETAPQDAATGDLVRRLRDDVLPPLADRTGTDYHVGGATAAAQDFAATVADRLPLFVGLVVGVSAILLMLVFRSVLIPIKAALLNLLSISAALGAITLVFQDGRFGAQEGPIEAFVPVMIFAIVFGLSMDYEVFLMSRIHEEWVRTGDASVAVREGVAATGKVITAAASIMIVVFGAFMLSPSRMLQMFGLGLMVAILLDAVVIRCLIVPAVMQLLGRHAWWLPAPLDRWLPSVALERPATADWADGKVRERV